MNRVALAGLLSITLPGHTIRLCDGGFKVLAGQTYRGKDATFGTVVGVQPLSEGVGDSVPALSLVLAPPTETAVTELLQPGHQTARVVFTIVEFDPETNVIIASEVQFNGQIDQGQLRIGDKERLLELSVVSLAERLFEGNIGNSLSPTWHKSVWPGELGHDNATGLAKPVAWGVESPGSASSSASVGAPGAGYVGRSDFPRQNIRKY